MTLSGRYGVELPICRGVYDVIYHKQDPQAVLSELFLRSLKQEF